MTTLSGPAFVAKPKARQAARIAALAPDDTWKRIEHAIGVASPCLPLRRALLRIVEVYYWTTQEPPVRKKHIREALRNVRGAAVRLRHAITRNVGETTAEELAQADTIMELLPGDQRRHLSRMLDEIIGRADARLVQVKADRGGSVKDWRLHTIVGALEAAYVNATGTSARLTYNSEHYRQRFVRLVWAFFTEVAPRVPDGPKAPPTKAAMTKLLQSTGKGLTGEHR